MTVGATEGGPEMSLEDSLRSIRDARGLRVNEDLIVWAARLETGRQRSGRSGVTLEVLQDTWRKMHITVSDRENSDLMQILDEHRSSANGAAQSASSGPVTGSAAAQPAMSPGAAVGVPATALPTASASRASSTAPASSGSTPTSPASGASPVAGSASQPGRNGALPSSASPGRAAEPVAPASGPLPAATPAAGPVAGPPAWYLAARAAADEQARVRSTQGGPDGRAPSTGPDAQGPGAHRSDAREAQPDGRSPSGRTETRPQSGNGPSPTVAGPPAWYTPPPVTPTDPPAERTQTIPDVSEPPPAAARVQPLPPVHQSVPSGPALSPVATTKPHPPTPPRAASATWSGPLPDPGMFSGQADVLNPHDGYMGLTATPDYVQLMWEHAEPRDSLTIYLVVGSNGQVPNTASEAERLAVTAETGIRVAPGARYYAVFAYQGGSPIAAAHDMMAVRQAVGQVVPSPVKVEFVVNPDSVVLEWQQPSGVTGVQLRRSKPDEPLPTFSDSSLIKQVLPGQNNYLDLDVEPGKTYIYELVCLADAPRLDGGTDQSPPWSSGPVVIPALPQRVDGLDGSMGDSGGQVRCTLSWPTVSRGKVSIFAKPGGPGVLGEIAPDRILTAEELTRLPLGNRVVWGLTKQNDRDVLAGFAVDVSASPEWCFTPVTEMAGKYILGRSQVLTHVGAIAEAELTDRIFWQFLRFEWPTGAAEVVAEVDGIKHRTSHEKYELYGGVRLTLSAHPTVVRLWGTRTYRGVPLVGRAVEVRYPGRQILYYQIDYSRFGTGRRLRVRPEIPMPGLELMVMGGVDLYPLVPEQYAQPGFGPVHTVSVPAGGLSMADWTVYEFKQPEQAHYLRLFARSSTNEPIAAVEWPPPAPPVNRISRRCPNCLAPPNPQNQFFRCGKEGTCVPVEDALLTRVRGVPTSAKPWSVHPIDKEGPIGQIYCAHCGKPTREEFCVQCGETFPTSDWWSTDSFAATMLGPRHSGKTSMLQAQSYSLIEGLAETWGGHANALDPASRALMKRYHDEWESGQLQQGTVAARANREVLRPIQMTITFPQYPRPVAMSLFDVAGEDMEDPDQVALYSNSLLNGDALIYLVDPLQITEVRTALAGFVTLPMEGGATPVQGLQNVITVLRRKFGMGPKLPIRLALVFSKFDAIQQATAVPGSPIAGALPFGSALLRDPYSNPNAQPLVFDPVDGQAVHNEARTLLSMLGGSSILNMVEGNFASFHYFVTSSTGHTPASSTMHSTAKAPHRLFDPLRWVIQG